MTGTDWRGFEGTIALERGGGSARMRQKSGGARDRERNKGIEGKRMKEKSERKGTRPSRPTGVLRIRSPIDRPTDEQNLFEDWHWRK